MSEPMDVLFQRTGSGVYATSAAGGDRKHLIAAAGRMPALQETPINAPSTNPHHSSYRYLKNGQQHSFLSLEIIFFDA